jgi:hypothetical protein
LEGSLEIGPWEIRSFRVLNVKGRARIRQVDLLERACESTRRDV